MRHLTFFRDAGRTDHCEEAVAAAQYLTKSNDNDGVAYFLEGILDR